MASLILCPYSSCDSNSMGLTFCQYCLDDHICEKTSQMQPISPIKPPSPVKRSPSPLILPLPLRPPLVSSSFFRFLYFLYCGFGICSLTFTREKTVGVDKLCLCVSHAQKTKTLILPYLRSCDVCHRCLR